MTVWKVSFRKMSSKLMGLLSICRKAGKMVMGFEPSKEAILCGTACSVITASDISPKTEKEIRFFADKKNIPVVESDCTMEDFYNGIGKKVGLIALCDEGFSKKAIEISTENI
ncbi:MAG: ribosomal L7Ae/L30e/S12e/Gadd45 family protein [Oscillospiraceae bacterium]|nr:ribosomal L7Ae/L30e/S12e/Gadd45 family protein [Oscillospiraceae bacterium]